MNNRSVFPLRMPQNIRQDIRNRASLERRTQTDLILEAVKVYLLKSYNQKTAS